MERYLVHLDDSRIGSGQRIVIVLLEGRKWTTLFYPPTLIRFRLFNAMFKRSIKKELGPVSRDNLDVIDRAVTLYDREDIQYSRKAVEQIRKAAAHANS